jgi:kumamolisin
MTEGHPGSVNPNSTSEFPSGRRVPIAGGRLKPPAGARYLGAADDAEIVVITVVLRRRPDGVPRPDFEHFSSTPWFKRRRLGQDEFASKFGASPVDADKVVAFAKEHGLTVRRVHLARRSITISGNPAGMSAAFSVKLGRFEHEIARRPRSRPMRETYRGGDGDVLVPIELDGIVVGVFGLDNRRIGARNGRSDSPDPQGTGNLTVGQVTQLYNFPTNSADGQTIGIVSFDGYDLDILQNTLGTSTPSVTPVLIDGAVNDGALTGETYQDICVASLAAPGAAIAVYLSTDDQRGWFDLIQRVVHPDPGDPVCFVLSSSYYFLNYDDANLLVRSYTSLLNAVDEAFRDAAIQGLTVCIASGDTGAGDGFTNGTAHVQYPASDPWVLSCGGTTIGNIQGSSFDEYVWNDSYAGDNGPVYEATGGGVSAFFPLPPYQQGANVPVSLVDGVTIGRGVPDVAGNASHNSGYDFLPAPNEVPYDASGTSAVAPLYAGLFAVINAALGAPVGFINPLIYQLQSAVCRDVNPYATTPPSGPVDNSLDGTVGYPAGPGWDACTGWGSINGGKLLAALQSAWQRALSVISLWDTFNEGPIEELLALQAPAPVNYPMAFVVVAEAFTSNELGIGTANAIVPQLTMTPAVAGMVITCTGTSSPVVMDPNAPQRFTFDFQVSFSSVAGFPPVSYGPLPVEIKATLSLPSGAGAEAWTSLNLVNQASPYMLPEPSEFGSSPDVRIFKLRVGESFAPVTEGWGTLVDSGDPSADGTAFVQDVIRCYNSLAVNFPPDVGQHPFDQIPSTIQGSTAYSQETDPNTGVRQHNFAVARVRFNDPMVDAKNVRVFFRTFLAYPGARVVSKTNPVNYPLAFDPGGAYRRWSDGIEFGQTNALLGLRGQDIVSVPYFAEQRVDSTVTSMILQTDNPNVQTMAHSPSGTVVCAYFGCWLDLNQAVPDRFPANFLASSDGPFNDNDPSNPLTGTSTVAQAIPAAEPACLVAEIAYDPFSIPTGALPSRVPLLGQRFFGFTAIQRSTPPE